METELEMARLQGAGLREELQEAEEQHSRELELLTEQVRDNDLPTNSSSRPFLQTVP